MLSTSVNATKMKASELRIGNWVNTEGNELIVDGRVINDAWMGKFKTIEGIPLTEQWLVKFGFKRSDTIGKSSSFLFIMIGGSELHINPDNGVVWIERNTNVFNNPALIEYVHQLQNLYFALTGEELTIKET